MVRRRSVWLVAATVLILSGVQPLAAQADDAPGQGKPKPPAATMGHYAPGQFAAEAAQLPQGIADAVRRDLGTSPEAYLADAQAAADASRVLAELRTRGIEVKSSQLEGQTLTVNVAHAADAAAVEATGAVVTVDKPVEHYVPPVMHKQADLLGGTAYYFDAEPGVDGGYRCSVGFNGVSKSTSAAQFVTAGHCEPYASSQPVYAIDQRFPNDENAPLGAMIGTTIDGSFTFGGGYDSGLQATTNAVTPQPKVATWGGGGGAPASGTQLLIRGDIQGVVGSVVCKSGSTTGWRCGYIEGVDQTVGVSDTPVNLYITSACSLEGDSGGAAVVGALALGITSAGTARSGATTCASGDKSGIFPMKSATGLDIEDQHSDWELSAFVPPAAPSLSGGTVFQGKPITGTVPGGNAQETVKVYFDGATDGAGPSTTATPSGNDLAWSAPQNLGLGSHTYRIVVTWGTKSASSAVTGSFTVVPAPAVDRLSGADRYSAAVSISQAAYPSTHPDTVYVATGANYPDALSAAPAAVKRGGPLLLTAPTSLPTAVADEIQRLQPQNIVVVGGVNSVSSAVYTQLSSLVPGLTSIKRINGADRFEASRNIVRDAFPSAATVYVATGFNFPDALAASGAGGALDAPVILVPGNQATLDPATAQLIRDLGATTIKIAGGPNSVSTGIQSGLASIATTTRLSGNDRFSAAVAINADAFAPSRPHVYVATGFNFPDALAGAALAGKNTAPVYLAQTSCLPQGIATEVKRLNATALTLLGGPNSLDANVAALKLCAG